MTRILAITIILVATSAQAELIWSLLDLLAMGVEPSWIGVCDLADRW